MAHKELCWEDFLEPLAAEDFEAAAIQGALEPKTFRVGFSTMGLRFAPAVEALCRRAAKLLAVPRRLPRHDDISHMTHMTHTHIVPIGYYMTYYNI